MKKMLACIAVGILAACNTNPSKDESTSSTKDTTMAAPAAIQSPDYPIAYSSDFVRDDPANAESLLKLWKVWDEGDLSKGKDLFADNDTMYLADGSVMKGPRDSIIAASQRYRSSLGSSVSRVDAITTLKSVDRNTHWALIWGMEKDSANGKVDSFYLQETWRFNKDGKADLLLQFRRSAPSGKK